MGRAMRVLIVEDEYLIAMDIMATLKRGGCEVAGVAGSVSKALRLIEDQSCDAVILDANLYGDSAEPVAAALRQRGIPYLVVSGYSTGQRAGLLATAPFLAKPCAPADLIAAVQALQS